MRFSERLGYRSARAAIQVDEIDDALRIALWNVVQDVIWDSGGARNGYYTVDSGAHGLIRALWRDLFKAPLDSIPEGIDKTIQVIRKYFFECEWFAVYDFMEFVCASLGHGRLVFAQACNEALEREMSGYRLIDSQIARITSQEELNAIDESIASAKGNIGAQTHLRRALELLSDRQAPDYRNSIKESISAVESTVKRITASPSASLGEALRSIGGSSHMHPALVKSLSALYGYTSDSDGIRHALLDEPNLDFDDAKFMLVACASFINLLIAKASPG